MYSLTLLLGAGKCQSARVYFQSEVSMRAGQFSVCLHADGSPIIAFLPDFDALSLPQSGLSSPRLRER